MTGGMARVTSALVSADDRGWLGSSPSTDCHRIPSDRESAAQRSAARPAYPVHRPRASAAGEESEGSGTQGLVATGDDRFARYSVALAPTADRREVEFRASAHAWAARDHAEDLRSDYAHGPRQSGLGIHADSRGAGQPRPPCWSWDCGQCLEAQRHRAIARAKQADDMVDILEGTLEGTCGERLSHRGGFDGEGIGDPLPIVGDQSRGSGGADRRHYDATR